VATTDDRKVDDVVDDETEEVRTTRSAVDVLRHDQRRLLFDGDPTREPPIEAWVDGFTEPRAVINWWQAAAVRTFGRIDEVLPAEKLPADRMLWASLLGTHDDGEQFRRRILRKWLRPICTAAWRTLDGQATERLSHADDSERVGWHDIEPDREEHIAMRPAHSRLDTNQGLVLAELWGGFDDERELDRWLHRLPPATSGFHDPSLATRLTEPPAETRLLDDDRDAKTWRLRFAMGKLLPAFADAAAALQGEEVTKSERKLEWRQG